MILSLNGNWKGETIIIEKHDSKQINDNQIVFLFSDSSNFNSYSNNCSKEKFFKNH